MQLATFLTKNKISKRQMHETEMWNVQNSLGLDWVNFEKVRLVGCLVTIKKVNYTLLTQ